MANVNAVATVWVITYIQMKVAVSCTYNEILRSCT